MRIFCGDVRRPVGSHRVNAQPPRSFPRLRHHLDPPNPDTIAFFAPPYVASPAAGRFTVVISNDTNEDGSWDAVWESAVTVDAQGWCAELRIPFSQLRFNAAEQQTWGINVERYIQRKNETAWLELVPKNENGLASRMVPLTGLDGIRPARRLELAPYTAMRQEFVQPSAPAIRSTTDRGRSARRVWISRRA